MAGTSDIGKSRRQRVFAVLETNLGEFEWPDVTDFIRPAGNAVGNQVPEFMDSEELTDSLDILAQFQNAMPAGEWSVPMYARPNWTAATVGGTISTPQGHALFVSMQGMCITGCETVLGATAGATAESLAIGAIVNPDGTQPDILPECGTILIGDELIRYTSWTGGATTSTLSGLTRGYGNTTATAHASGASVTLQSYFYKQAQESPSFTLWIQTDHFLQAIAGCTVGSGKLSVSNQGAVKIDFSGQGTKMTFAGTGTLTTVHASTATALTITNIKAFCPGEIIDGTQATPGYRVWNKTNGTDNTGEGFTVTSVTVTDDAQNIGVLHLAEALGVTGATGDVIQGFLPTDSVVAIGEPIESRYTRVLINSLSATFKSGDLTINVPKQYITDEVGTFYPQGYVENVREITSSLGLYFRQADARYFTEGYASNDVPVLLSYGKDDGKRLDVYMKRCKLQVPTVEFNAPVVNLTVPLKALGTDGEDSLEITFN